MRHTLPFHRSSHRFAAVASFLLVTAFLAVTGCVSKGTYKAALAERDDAQARNAALQKDAEAAKARLEAGQDKSWFDPSPDSYAQAFLYVEQITL